jgi:ribosome biogenesis GTPase / thiamine phosphate phosphatase
MLPSPLLADLGWSAEFLRQLPPDEINDVHPARVSGVHRDRLSAQGADGALSLTLPPGLSAAEIAVGDWLLYDPAVNRVLRRLDRKSHLTRRAAGTVARPQLIAANVDTAFLTSSCNQDFNEARLERFLSLIHAGGVTPVLVLTRADLCTDPAEYLQRFARNAVQFARGGGVASPGSRLRCRRWRWMHARPMRRGGLPTGAGAVRRCAFSAPPASANRR